MRQALESIRGVVRSCPIWVSIFAGPVYPWVVRPDAAPPAAVVLASAILSHRRLPCVCPDYPGLHDVRLVAWLLVTSIIVFGVDELV